MKRICSIVLALIMWVTWAKCEDKSLDVGIVLDISGDWSLQSATNSGPVPLRKGHALPAGGTISSSSPTGKIIIHIYNKTQPDIYSTPPSPSSFALPTTLEKSTGFPERFWKIFQRLFGGHPDDFTITISQIPANIIYFGSYTSQPQFINTNNNNTLLNFDQGPPNYDGSHHLPIFCGVFGDGSQTGQNTLGFDMVFNYPEASPTFGSLYALKPVTFRGSDIFSSAWPKNTQMPGDIYLWNTDSVFHAQVQLAGVPIAYQNWGLTPVFSKVDLKEAVLELNGGWVDLSPLFRKEAPKGNTLAFRRIVPRGQLETHQYPDILFTWPSSLSATSAAEPASFRYEVPLQPGLYRVSYFDLALNQPSGDDAWVLVEPSGKYDKSEKFFEDSSHQVDSWPKDLDTTLRRSFLRVCLQYLSEPETGQQP